MRWFKHLLGNNEGDSQFISELLIKHGPDGYYVFYRTLEIMCIEFDIDKPAENVFHFEYFYSKFVKIYRKTLRKVLESCDKTYQKSGESRGIGYREEGENIYLRCCKLKELSDKYTQKALAEKKKKYPQGDHKVRPLDIDKDLDIDIDKRKEYVPTEVETSLALLLKNKILSNNPKAKIKENGWAKDVDLMIRIDNRTPDEIKEVIEFSQSHEFWWKNILSMGKLRKQFDKLTNELRGEKKNGKDKGGSRKSEIKYPVDIE